MKPGRLLNEKFFYLTMRVVHVHATRTRYMSCLTVYALRPEP
jgi:hypothetical protein